MNIDITADTIVIAHGNCPDGACAAWVFSQAGAHKRSFGQVQYHFTTERDFHKDGAMPNLTGKDVYIVDYCYPMDVLVNIRKIAKSLTVLDHHKTSREMVFSNFSMVNDIQINMIFDLERCGAEIVWDHLYGSETRPWFIKHIRDRDLWLWENPNSRAFSAALASRGHTFETFDALLYENPQIVYTRGRECEERVNTAVANLCSRARAAKFEGYDVLVLETVEYRSECGAALAAKCDFALLYNRVATYTENNTVDSSVNGYECWVSLRGTASRGLDLTTFAKKYGGGGHPLACGFTYRGDIEELLQ